MRGATNTKHNKKDEMQNKQTSLVLFVFLSAISVSDRNAAWL